MAEIIKQQDTRREFIDTLCELAKNDKDILFVICDTGFNYAEKFQKLYPSQFFNFGVTEQTTTIICAALALSGKKVFFYSMINFVTMRPYEMLRNAVCYHNANVKLIGVKGSEKYKFLGFSHNVSQDEDIKILNHLPNLKIFIPKTQEEVKKVVLETYKRKGPAYIRL